MPRVPRDLTNYGKVYTYTVLLYRKENNEDVAITKFGLDVDSKLYSIYKFRSSGDSGQGQYLFLPKRGQLHYC